MIPAIRKKYNAEFSQQRYENFLKELNSAHPGQIEFRVAETPVFVPKDFQAKMLSACEKIIDVIQYPDFKKCYAVSHSGRANCS